MHIESSAPYILRKFAEMSWIHTVEQCWNATSGGTIKTCNATHKEYNFNTFPKLYLHKSIVQLISQSVYQHFSRLLYRCNSIIRII